jgi:hypothetical protein
LKIAFDENVPHAMVRVFQTFANEYQLKKLSGNFEVKSARDYTPQRGDPDYAPNNDAPWLKRFAADGGKVVISGDTNMKYVPHERLALIECGFIVIFFESQWSNWKFFRKCALLLHWWPQVATKARRAKPGSFWHIPCTWSEKGRLRKVSNEDPRKLKIEQQQKKPRKRKPKVEAPAAASHGPLFEYAKPKTKVADAKETEPSAESR